MGRQSSRAASESQQTVPDGISVYSTESSSMLYLLKDNSSCQDQTSLLLPNTSVLLPNRLRCMKDGRHFGNLIADLKEPRSRRLRNGI